MEDNNTKKIILSVVGIAIMIIAVIGVSFAVYQFSTGVTGTNTINSGTITMSYSEPAAGIELINALPMSDATGKAMNDTDETFEFSVSTHASGTLNIPYEINILVNSDDYGTGELLADSQVKIYLYDETNDEDAVTPVLISTLGASSKRSGAKVLYTTTDNFVNGNSGTTTTTSYIMKIWIDGAVDIASISDDEYEYHVKVNVDSTVAPK